MKFVKENKQGRVDVKKSIFLAYVFYVESEDDVKAYLQEVNNEHNKAKHVVYAACLLENKILRDMMHNAKEPKGSAAKPLLYLLKKKDIVNCLLVVVRYYGGTKLGVGGLVRAYTKAAQVVLEDNLFDSEEDE